MVWSINWLGIRKGIGTCDWDVTEGKQDNYNSLQLYFFGCFGTSSSWFCRVFRTSQSEQEELEGGCCFLCKLLLKTLENLHRKYRCCSQGLPLHRDLSEVSRVQQKRSVGWSTWPMRKGSGNWACLAAFRYLKGGYWEDTQSESLEWCTEWWAKTIINWNGAGSDSI